MKRVCVICKAEFDSIGHKQYCGTCFTARRLEKQNLAARIRYAANPEKIITRQALRRNADPEKFKAVLKRRRDNNIESHRERWRRWRAKNADKYREKSRNWSNDNREKVREANRKWKANNPEKVKAAAQSRRCSVGVFTADELKAKFEAMGNKCAHCGATDKKLTVDHITPLKLGGTNYIDNIQPLCRSCNCRKGARFIG